MNTRTRNAKKIPHSVTAAFLMLMSARTNYGAKRINRETRIKRATYKRPSSERRCSHQPAFRRLSLHPSVQEARTEQTANVETSQTCQQSEIPVFTK